MALAGLDDGLISGLREDQLVTAEEVDSAVREVPIARWISLLGCVPCGCTFTTRRANVLKVSHSLCAQSIEQAVGANAFQHSKVNAWTANIVVRPDPCADA